MTIEQLTQWMEHPETLQQEQIAGLRELTDAFPYFSISRMLLLKALQNSNDLLYGTEVRKTATYCNDRRKLYFLLYPQKTAATHAATGNVLSDLSGDYFTLHELGEPAESGQSLKSMAQRLKAARLQKQQGNKAVPTSTISKTAVPIQPNVAPPKIESSDNLIYTEEEAIRLIRAKQFDKALKILHVLHLNIPEKSVYFADQIRYLEKIIATINKS